MSDCFCDLICKVKNSVTKVFQFYTNFAGFAAVAYIKIDTAITI